MESTDGITGLQTSWMRKDDKKFSTRDRDNDIWALGHCAQKWASAGWLRQCTYIHLNGQYGAEGDSGKGFIFWEQFKGYNALKSIDLSIKRNE